MKPALSYAPVPERRRDTVDRSQEIDRRGFVGLYRPPMRLLPHEYVFGLFLVLTWVRLVLQAGPFRSSSLAFLGCLLTSFAVILWASRRPTRSRWRVRLLLYAVLMGLSFFLLPSDSRCSKCRAPTRNSPDGIRRYWVKR